jgi:hypothetical protein
VLLVRNSIVLPGPAPLGMVPSADTDRSWHVAKTDENLRASMEPPHVGCEATHDCLISSHEA